MNNVLQTISAILSAGVLVFLFLRAARKAGSKPVIDFGLVLQATILFSLLGALIYIALEFIFV
jgi:hypothetical protein